jgi:hypothetical protein
VEGKEAVQHIARRIVAGELRGLLDKLVILIVPIYNADGNEKISTNNRVAQNGPIHGVGVRENAKGLDLNRDYIKIDAPETAALIHLFNTWDPHLTVDLHTTNGSYHAYHLTYSAPLNPMTDPAIFAYHHDKMLPAIAEAMQKNHQYRTYYYGNFNPSFATAPPGQSTRPGVSASEPARGARSSGPPTAWYAFSPAPRVGQNYLGLRNRLTILSEAYSYLDFKARVEVTDAFVVEIFRYAAAHADEIRALTQAADQAVIRRGLKDAPFQLSIAYEPQAWPTPVDILVGQVTKLRNPVSGKDMTAVVPDQFTAARVTDYRFFKATHFVPAARAYIFRDEPGLHVLTEKLLAHGITVERTTGALETQVDALTITTVGRSALQFQNHREVFVRGDYKQEKIVFPAGSVLVRTAQPLGALVAYLLEPESDDGLTTWNFLDEYLGQGKTHPVCKIMNDFSVPTERVAY